ncbi:reverse transcriptase domain-containing protein [Tanacetum coccineum]
MAGTRTMAQLLRVPTEGNAEAIVVPTIPAEHFELKHSLLNLVTSKQFFGFVKEDPHAHIRWFNKITSTMKYKDVPNLALKLMLFPFSIDGPARIWIKKEPPHSITTWDDLVSMFIKKFFPPSKTTNLHNEISNFQQRFDEPFHETWDRFKDLLLSTNTSTSGLSPDVVALTDAVNALLLKNTTPPLVFVKAVEESCVTCGGPHPYYQCPVTNGNAFPGYQDNIQAYVFVAAVNYNQGNARHHPLSVAHQVRPPGFPPVHNNQNRGNNYNLGNLTYRALTPPTQAASSNELANYMKKLSLPELTPTKMILTLEDRSTTRPTGIAEDVFVRVGKTTRALNDVYGEELTLRVGDDAITFKVGNTSKFSYNDPESINRIDVIDVACEEYSQEVLGFFGNSESGNPTLISEPIIAKSSPSLTLFEGGDFILEEIEGYLASDSVPPGIDSEDIIKILSPQKNSGSTTDHADVSLPEYERFYSEGDIRLLEKFLNNDPSSPLLPKEIKAVELKNEKSSVDEPPELELKDLPSHLEYAFLEGTNKLPVIIAKNLKDEEKERLIKVLKSHKQAIAWKLSDIKGIDLQFCTRG